MLANYSKNGHYSTLVEHQVLINKITMFSYRIIPYCEFKVKLFFLLDDSVMLIIRLYEPSSNYLQQT
jgi:hypothetical protein